MKDYSQRPSVNEATIDEITKWRLEVEGRKSLSREEASRMQHYMKILLANVDELNGHLDYLQGPLDIHTGEPTPTVRSKLQQATRLIEQAMRGLNISSTPCECCSHRHYDYYSEWQCYQQLSHILSKLERWSSAVDVKDIELFENP